MSSKLPLDVCTERDWLEQGLQVASKNEPQCGTEKKEDLEYQRLQLRMDIRSLAQGGTKHDTGKPDLSLLPKPALEAMAEALMYGEKKYGRYNYTKGFDSHRLFAAIQRHLLAWQDGETNDPESGLSHLSHALASLAMLIHCKDLGTLVDTRYKKD